MEDTTPKRENEIADSNEIQAESSREDFAHYLMAALTERLTNDGDLKLFLDNFIAAYTRPASEAHSEDFIFDLIRPVVISLIRFKDDTLKELGFLKDMLVAQDCNNEATDYAVEIIEDVLGGIDDMLLYHDVQPYRCESEGERFNAMRQSVVKTIPASGPEQVKTIAESRSYGYERRGVVISKERVVAYASVPGATTNNDKGDEA